MIALIALRLPVLGFCLCENDVILNGDSCCEEAATGQSSCGCCPEILRQTEKKPCRDCVVILSLDPGDFQWTASQFSPSKEDLTPLDLPINFATSCLPSRPPTSVPHLSVARLPWETSRSICGSRS